MASRNLRTPAAESRGTPTPAHAAAEADAVLAPAGSAGADVASASAMASLSGLSDSTPVATYATVMLREGAARVETLHRNAANVKLKTADGKSIWTKEEDTSVLHFVVDWIRSRKIKPSVPYTDWKWEECADGYLARTRSSKQCRERWANVLNPLSKHDEPWTKAEIDLLLQLHTRFGKKWREVAKRCPGRTTNKVKNLFYSCERRARKRDTTITEGTEAYSNAVAAELYRVQAAQEREGVRSTIAGVPLNLKYASTQGIVVPSDTTGSTRNDGSALTAVTSVPPLSRGSDAMTRIAAIAALTTLGDSHSHDQGHGYPGHTALEASATGEASASATHMASLGTTFPRQYPTAPGLGQSALPGWPHGVDQGAGSAVPSPPPPGSVVAVTPTGVVVICPDGSIQAADVATATSAIAMMQQQQQQQLAMQLMIQQQQQQQLLAAAAAAAAAGHHVSQLGGFPGQDLSMPIYPAQMRSGGHHPQRGHGLHPDPSGLPVPAPTTAIQYPGMIPGILPSMGHASMGHTPMGRVPMGHTPLVVSSGVPAPVNASSRSGSVDGSVTGAGSIGAGSTGVKVCEGVRSLSLDTGSARAEPSHALGKDQIPHRSSPLESLANAAEASRLSLAVQSRFQGSAMKSSAVWNSSRPQVSPRIVGLPLPLTTADISSGSNSSSSRTAYPHLSARQFTAAASGHEAAAAPSASSSSVMPVAVTMAHPAPDGRGLIGHTTTAATLASTDGPVMADMFRAQSAEGYTAIAPASALVDCEITLSRAESSARDGSAIQGSAVTASASPPSPSRNRNLQSISGGGGGGGSSKELGSAISTGLANSDTSHRDAGHHRGAAALEALPAINIWSRSTAGGVKGGESVADFVAAATAVAETTLARPVVNPHTNGYHTSDVSSSSSTAPAPTTTTAAAAIGARGVPLINAAGHRHQQLTWDQVVNASEAAALHGTGVHHTNGGSLAALHGSTNTTTSSKRDRRHARNGHGRAVTMAPAGTTASSSSSSSSAAAPVQEASSSSSPQPHVNVAATAKHSELGHAICIRAPRQDQHSHLSAVEGLGEVAFPAVSMAPSVSVSASRSSNNSSPKPRAKRGKEGSAGGSSAGRGSAVDSNMPVWPGGAAPGRAVVQGAFVDRLPGGGADARCATDSAVLPAVRGVSANRFAGSQLHETSGLHGANRGRVGSAAALGGQAPGRRDAASLHQPRSHGRPSMLNHGSSGALRVDEHHQQQQQQQHGHVRAQSWISDSGAVSFMPGPTVIVDATAATAASGIGHPISDM